MCCCAPHPRSPTLLAPLFDGGAQRRVMLTVPSLLVLNLTSSVEGASGAAEHTRLLPEAVGAQSRPSQQSLFWRVPVQTASRFLQGLW